MVLYQESQPREGTQAHARQLFSARPSAIGEGHSNQQLGTPERCREGIANLMSDEGELARPRLGPSGGSLSLFALGRTVPWLLGHGIHTFGHPAPSSVAYSARGFSQWGTRLSGASGGNMFFWCV